MKRDGGRERRSPASAFADFNRKIIEEFRANGGNVGGGFAGAPMLILHTTGAKTGAEREHPLSRCGGGGARGIPCAGDR